jgi:hypothetical protein
MTRTRWLFALLAALLLAALLFWQAAREHQVEECRRRGGIWDGPRSHCLPDPGQIRIQRDIYRS